MSAPSTVPRRELVAVALAVVVVGVVALLVPGLLTGARLRDGVAAGAPVLVASVAMTLLLAHRELDLSVGPQLVAGTVLTAALGARAVPLPATVLLVMLAGALVGAVNGELVALLGLPAILVTAATGLAAEQGWRWLLSGPPAPVLPRTAQWLGLPPRAGAALLAAIAIAVVALGAFVLRRGSRTVRARVGRFVLVGALAALAGFLEAIRPGAAATSAGAFEVRILAAALLGGTAAAGVRGTMLGTFSGALVMSAIAAAVPLVPRLAPWGAALDGAVLLAALPVAGVLRSPEPLGLPLDAGTPPLSWPVGLVLLLGCELAVIGPIGGVSMSLANFAEVARMAAEIGFVALPLAALLAEETVDLGVAGTAALATAALGLALELGGMGAAAAAALTLFVGLVVGTLHASLITKPGLPGALVTLAAGAGWLGAADALVSRARKPLAPLPGRWLQVARGLLFDALPYPVIVLGAMAVVFYLFERRKDRALPPVLRAGFLFVASGLGCALAALTVAGRRGSVRFDAPASFALAALAATVLGGAQPRVPGSVGTTLLASLAIAVLINGVPMAFPGAPAGPLVALVMIAALALRRGRAGGTRQSPAADTAQG